MKFGVFVATKIDDWQLIKYAEDLGYDTAWVPDSQMIWSDCYATLALAAANTKRIRLGTGVAIPGTRIAPVTAHSIASIAKIAPGRVFLGIGTGHTAMLVTHNQAEAFAIADRIGVMKDGQLAQWDTPYALHRHPASPFVAEFVRRDALADERARALARGR